CGRATRETPRARPSSAGRPDTMYDTTSLPALSYDRHGLVLNERLADTPVPSRVYVEHTAREASAEVARRRGDGAEITEEQIGDTRFLTLTARQVPLSQFEDDHRAARLASHLRDLLPQLADDHGATLMLPRPGEQVLDHRSCAVETPSYATTADVVRSADLASPRHPWRGPVAVYIHSTYVILPYKAEPFDRQQAEAADRADFAALHGAGPD